jgi:hypothetical protein
LATDTTPCWKALPAQGAACPWPAAAALDLGRRACVGDGHAAVDEVDGFGSRGSGSTDGRNNGCGSDDGVVQFHGAFVLVSGLQEAQWARETETVVAADDGHHP